MKTTLIRLHTENNDAVFDCDFQDDIIIKENTEIALHSLSIERQNKKLDVDATNDTINFQVSTNAGTHDISIPHGKLSSTNIGSTLRDITDLMNSQLRFFRGTPLEIANGDNPNTKETGMQIKVSTDNSKKVSFDFRYSGAVNALTANAGDLLDTVNMNTTSNEYKVADGTVAADSDTLQHANFAFKRPISLGTHISKVRIKKFTNTNGDQSGFIMGLTTEQNKITNNSLTLADLDFAIRVKKPADIIEVKNTKAGAFGNNAAGRTVVNVTTGGGFRDNDHLSFELRESVAGEGQKMHLMHYQSGAGGATELLKADIELRGTAKFNDVPYFFVVALLGDTNSIKLDNVGSCLNQYIGVPNTGELSAFDSENLVGLPQTLPSTLVRDTQYSLTMPSTLASFFGFDSAANASTGGNALFIGNRQFESVVNSDNYIVEMLNMPINTYDSLAKGRKNVLSYVPVSETIIDDDTGVVQYTAPYPLYLPLSNQFAMTLRNIRARIVANDFSQITSEGIASINILLRD
tara:strand:+ start:1192 stop:2754 length:1563 start_codon:yes stop_codon:yes gene_type:complete